MARPGQHLRGRSQHGLLARYSETLGEMMLRKHTETAIRAAKTEAELSSRSKNAFLGTMSHELRTPLNSIIGFSDIIRQPGGATPQQAAEFAEHIFKAGKRLQEVVSDVLDISKLESESLTLSVQPCLAGEITEAAADAMRAAFEQKKQVFELRVEPDMPEIYADPKRLKQLLINLLSNANKFTNEGGRILVMARPGADGGITIAIADTGVGMTADQIETALKPFAQLQSHFNRTQEGTGLGLPLADGLIRLHGGSLKIDSKPDAGTTVMVVLPKGKNPEGAA